MNFIKEYEIDVAGSTGGIADSIPANHRMLVTDICVFYDAIAEKWKMKMTVCTYEDNTYSQAIQNDNMPDNGVVVVLGDNLPATAIITTVKNEMNTLLDGYANVGDGNYTEDPA
jgi:hypothetical protein